MNAPQPKEEKGRILPFRQRAKARDAGPSHVQRPIEGLGKYAGGAQPDDYRHRMIINGLAFAICILLVAIGVWLADSIAEMRKNQDCVLSGRRNCANVIIAPPTNPN